MRNNPPQRGGLKHIPKFRPERAVPIRFALPFQGDDVCGFTRRVAAGCYAMSFQDEIFLKYFN
jgi:hypothetical protein